jgi:ceramide glucosyltransferase
MVDNGMRECNLNFSPAAVQAGPGSTGRAPAMSWAGIVLIAWGLVAASAVGCLYLGCSVLAVRRLVAPRATPLTNQAAVSVLKPLCGEDAGLAENLRSFCRQHHPHYQIVFGVRDEDDAAIPVVRRVMAEFPDVDLALVIDRRQRGRNLKVANLHNMLPAARHPILVLADSDMRVGPDYLATVAAPLAEQDIGLVTCLYRGIPAAGVWSRLACLHVNHGFLPQAALAAAIGAGAGCFGATIALRRETLERIGGLAAIEDALADDHELGAAVRRAGGVIELSPYLVDNVIAEPSLAALFRHEVRWARTIRLVAPWGFAGSILTQPVAVSVLAVALGALPVAAPAMLVLALACRCVAVRGIDRALGLRPSPLVLVPFRDLLSFAVFVASFFTRKVAWRNRIFRIGSDGEMTLDGDHPA